MMKLVVNSTATEVSKTIAACLSADSELVVARYSEECASVSSLVERKYSVHNRRSRGGVVTCIGSGE